MDVLAKRLLTIQRHNFWGSLPVENRYHLAVDSRRRAEIPRPNALSIGVCQSGANRVVSIGGQHDEPTDHDRD